MKDRIQMIMDAENMNAAKFADTLGVGRAVISNIMTERNRASLDIIMTILSKMPQINSDWLLFGKGDMYKDGVKTDKPVSFSPEGQLTFAPEEPELFQNPVKSYDSPAENEERKENILSEPQYPFQPIVTERVIYKEKAEKKIARIIVYYSDNTFEVFDAGK